MLFRSERLRKNDSDEETKRVEQNRRNYLRRGKLGKAEFFGFVGDFVETKKITGIVLLKGDKATDEQKHVVAITAQTQHIEAFIDLGGKVQPLVDPTPSKPAAPPAVEGQQPEGH